MKALRVKSEDSDELKLLPEGEEFSFSSIPEIKDLSFRVFKLEEGSKMDSPSKMDFEAEIRAIHRTITAMVIRMDKLEMRLEKLEGNYNAGHAEMNPLAGYHKNEVFKIELNRLLKKYDYV